MHSDQGCIFTRTGVTRTVPERKYATLGFAEALDGSQGYTVLRQYNNNCQKEALERSLTGVQSGAQVSLDMNPQTTSSLTALHAQPVDRTIIVVKWNIEGLLLNLGKRYLRACGIRRKGAVPALNDCDPLMSEQWRDGKSSRTTSCPSALSRRMSWRLRLFSSYRPMSVTSLAIT